MADTQETEVVNGTGQENQENSNNQPQLAEQATGNGNAEATNANGNTENHTVRDDDRKLFVGGLSWETSDKELKEHFSQYGDIESINVKTDPNTGRSRGFAFIVYKSADSIDKVVSAGDHVINNKKVDPKKAKARYGKIFVGGLTSEISDEEIKTFFGQFGNIVEIEMPFDKQKNQRKGFCFITFDSEQVVNELLKTPKQTISGKEVDVKKATPKPDNMGPMGPMGGRGGMRGPPPRGMRGGRGGPGGPKGGYGQGWGGQGYGGYGYGQGYGGGYGDYGYDYLTRWYGGYNNGGYDLSGGYYDDYGYGGYDGGYINGGRPGGPRGGGKGGAGTYGGGKQRGNGGGGRQQRHTPY
ncbi:RNA-binding protein squid-like isoform X4 [Anopheles funestus]|uniref:RNA-binding protein squid-like isoform X4 n=1 Tax=Anopheles funestus TaxID=62324 RepID=UPI0020C70BAD|nr:RNA-binding protein squid-like isoform X4 [Anopheles funestus]